MPQLLEQGMPLSLWMMTIFWFLGVSTSAIVMGTCAFTIAQARPGQQQLLKASIMSMKVEWRVLSAPVHVLISQQVKLLAEF